MTSTPPEPGDAFATPPAPVYTGEEAYDMRPLPRIAPPRRARPSRGRLATTALTLLTGLWVLALAASQATSPTIAVPFLERTISTLADVPALLQFHEQAIRRAAAQPGGDAPIPIPGFPVHGVTLPKALAQTGRVEEWRDRVLRESAQAAYERGPEVFATAGEAEATRAFATSRWVRLIMDIFSADAHATASRTAWILGLAALATGTLVLVLVDGVRRFVAVGLALIGGAMIAAVGGVLGMLLAIAMTVGSESVFITDVGTLVRAVSWTPIQDAVRLGIAGLAILVPAAGAAAWLGRHEERFDDVMGN
ncbi:MAG: hypothetical protein AB7G21_00735 [Dehalococcoidia bacterium]